MSNEDDQRIYQARDLLLAYLADHDVECPHVGECRVPIDLAAWIAHAIGIKGKARINAMESALERLNIECPNCTSRN